MPRLILELGAGAQTAAVQQAALDLASVDDAVTARQANAVIVSVPRITSATRNELAALPGVSRVFDDIQAIPQVAAEEDVEDFLNRVREIRGEENAPPAIETEPQDGLETDGGATTLPVAGAAEPAASTGPIESADDAIAFTGAPTLHDQGITGESVIAIVLDTGVCASAFADERRMEGADLTGEDDPWTPLGGHGGMTAGIMAGGPETPGIDVGMLPGADVYPIKSTLAATELIQAQDIIARVASQNPDRTVIANNSWGFQECAGICDHPVTGAIDATANDVTQVFAAGNQAAGITGCGQDCDGSTVGISGPNSLGNVITVGAAGRDGNPDTLHTYSSRGGSGGVSCGAMKPDLTAPIFGVIPWECGSKNIGNGGGTSAACPLVAGGVGLIADTQGGTSTAAATSGLTQTAEQYRGSGFNGCSGAGNLRVAEAAARSPVTAGFGSTTRVAAAGLTLGLVGAILRRRMAG